MWESSLRMRIIRAPHDAIGIEYSLACKDNARAILLECRPELAIEVGTRFLFELGFHPVAVVRPPMIHEAYQRGNPTNAAFGNDKAQFRVALRHTRPDQLGHAALPGQHLALDDSRADT